tara:strand:+ start:205 stop:540 length:336 start_codon:yes stop_codon:yes gene_type:complete
MNYYKQDEIQQYFYDWLADQNKDWINDNKDDLHHHCFNTDYYIIGYAQAEEWLGSKAFEIIGFIKDYEQDNFGEVYTDLSDSEKVVNMYTYIVGEQIVFNYLETLEEEKEE